MMQYRCGLSGRMHDGQCGHERGGDQWRCSGDQSRSKGASPCKGTRQQGLGPFLPCWRFREYCRLRTGCTITGCCGVSMMHALQLGPPCPEHAILHVAPLHPLQPDSRHRCDNLTLRKLLAAASLSAAQPGVQLPERLHGRISPTGLLRLPAPQGLAPWPWWDPPGEGAAPERAHQDGREGLQGQECRARIPCGALGDVGARPRSCTPAVHWRCVCGSESGWEV